MREVLLALMIVLMVIRYVVDCVDELFEWVMKPIDKGIKILSTATGIRLGED